MSERPENTRRLLLKGIGLAGLGAALLPERWTRPIIGALVEPAVAGPCDGSTGVVKPGCPPAIPVGRPVPTTTPTPCSGQVYPQC